MGRGPDATTDHEGVNEMKIALTGATGFLGRYLVTHLTQAGHHVTCWHPRGDASTCNNLPLGAGGLAVTPPRLLKCCVGFGLPGQSANRQDNHSDVVATTVVIRKI